YVAGETLGFPLQKQRATRGVAPSKPAAKAPETRSARPAKSKKENGAPRACSLAAVRSAAAGAAATLEKLSRQTRSAHEACELIEKKVDIGSAATQQLAGALGELSRRASDTPPLTSRALEHAARAQDGAQQILEATEWLKRLGKRLSTVAKELQ